MNDFRGPLFIVGMPRSGTKLLRDLLNRNPSIGIPVIETHFFPYIIRRHSDPGRWTHEELEKFFSDLAATPFYQDMSSAGKTLRLSDLEGRTYQGWEGLFEQVCRFYVAGEKAPDFVWGDKTPGYLNHRLTLKQAFPHARFLHILRDPRDYCLSVRKAWGKSMYRAAARWQQSVSLAREQAPVLGSDYMEVRYEELLEEPERVLRGICVFLGQEYLEVMQTLGTTSTEKVGDAKGSSTIVRHNKGKFEAQMSVRQLKRIEEIVHDAATGAGYEMRHADRHRPLTGLVLTSCRLYDGVAVVLSHARSRGVARGLQYFVRHSRSSLGNL